jgi:protein SCO1/2
MTPNSQRVAVLLALIGTHTLCAQPARMSADQRRLGASQYFTDVVVTNQDGTELRLYSDLLAGRTIIMIPFFTTCTGVCPPMNRNLQRLQEWLGDRLGKDVVMLSITVDPETDTIPKLKEYAQRYHAKPGWHFIGGKKDNVEFTLKKLGQYVAMKEEHSSIMILGNLQTGLWKKAFALAPIADLLKIVESVVEDKAEAPAAGGSR